MKNKIEVTKASGYSEEFSIEKLKNSLLRAKASPQEVEAILAELIPGLYDGISTKKIYTDAFRLLRQQSRPKAARYYLKKAIMDLGPSGFPFEKFIAAIFNHQGYAVKNGVILQGKCVNHEIDVIAEKENEISMMECKYQNYGGDGVDVKVPLYIHSRFEDILSTNQYPREKFKGWIVTNLRFTKDATSFGSCKGINLLAWSYPKGNGLKEIIDNTMLYPITCLTLLTKYEKNLLLEKGVVLVKDLIKNQELISSMGIKENRFHKIMEECSALCKQ